MTKIPRTLELFMMSNGTVYSKRLKREIPLTVGNTGYEVFGGFNKDRARRVFYHHRAVWETFKGRIPKGMCINHKNGNKQDNRLSNLEVVSLAENNKHCREVLRGGGAPPRSISERQIKRIKILMGQGFKLVEISSKIGVSKSVLSNITRKNCRAYREHSADFQKIKASRLFKRKPQRR